MLRCDQQERCDHLSFSLTLIFVSVHSRTPPSSQIVNLSTTIHPPARIKDPLKLNTPHPKQSTPHKKVFFVPQKVTKSYTKFGGGCFIFYIYVFGVFFIGGCHFFLSQGGFEGNIPLSNHRAGGSVIGTLFLNPWGTRLLGQSSFTKLTKYPFYIETPRHGFETLHCALR